MTPLRPALHVALALSLAVPPAARAAAQDHVALRAEGTSDGMAALAERTPGLAALGVRPEGLVAREHRLELEGAGPWTVLVTADDLDPYVFVRDAAGRIVGEDADGGAGTDARLVLEGLAPGVVTVVVCAPAGRDGEYALRVERGVAAPPPDDELPRLRQRVARCEERHGPTHRSVGDAAVDLGTALLALEEAEQAAGELARGRDVLVAALGEGQADVADATTRLAEARFALMDDAAAEALFRAAIAAYEALGREEDVGLLDAVLGLGLLQLETGDALGSRTTTDRALRIAEATLGREHPRYWEIVSGRARCEFVAGDTEAAQRWQERALQGLERCCAGTAEWAFCALTLAIVQATRQDPAGARALLERALPVYEATRGVHHPETLVVVSALGTLALRIGDVPAATAYHARVLDIYEALGVPWTRERLNALLNLASDRLLSGDLAAARATLLSFRERASGVLADDDTMLGFAWCWLAQVDRREGRLAEAADELARAEAIFAASPDELGGQPTTIERVMLLRAQGDRDGALGTLRAALEGTRATYGDEDSRTALVRGQLALLLWETGDQAGARAQIGAAHAGFEDLLRRNLVGLTEHETFTFARRLRWSLDALVSFTRGADTAERAEAYEALLRWKSLGRGLQGPGIGRTLQADPDLARTLADLRACQGELSTLLSARSSALDEPHWVERVGTLRAQRQALELEVRRRSWQGAADTGLDEVRAALGDDVAVVDLLVHPTTPTPPGERWDDVDVTPRVSAWILRGDLEAPLLLDLGPAEVLERAAERFAAGEGADLRHLLWDPLAPHLSSVATVVVSPDAFLATVPFEALPLDDGTWLVEHHAFVYQEDVLDLPHLLSRAPSSPSEVPPTLLVVGGLDYAQPAAGRPARWDALPMTARECAAILDLHRRHLGGDDGAHAQLTGAEASESRLKRELPLHAVLHLATHGYFDDGAGGEAEAGGEAGRVVEVLPGLLSGIVCSGANAPPADGSDDGLLTAEELQWLDLSNTGLIVLSACETALGRARSGEGMLGLRRACRVAGARTVVSSLWDVPDRGTSLLMVRFYGNLWGRGLGPLAALRDAQLSLLAERQPPRVWGGFVLSGDWR